jgi:methionine sulfoxide reductase heme-binding subunit
MTSAAVATATSPLWFATRATGLTALVLLTACVVPGILTSVRFAWPAWPRFVTAGLHRNLSLLALTFVGLHVLTTVSDPYASIGAVSAVVPFSSPYRRIWLGLGAVAFDLLLAVLVTSLLRTRIGLRTWRAVHWAGYLCWPVALIHGLGTGTDGAARWVLAVTAACALAVTAAGAWRLAVGWPAHAALRVTAAAAAVLVALGTVAWLGAGPLRPGWARRAGTPAALLARSGGTAVSAVRSAQSVFPAIPFQVPIAGTVTMQPGPGTGQRTVTIETASGTAARLRVVITGPAIQGGVEMAASHVSLGPPAAPQRYTGRLVALAGTSMQATVSGAGQRLTLTVDLAQSGGSVTGTLAAAVAPAAGSGGEGEGER